MIREASITDTTYEPYDDNNSPSSVITMLKNILSWKKITVTGTTAIDLSKLNYNELKIEVECTNNGTTRKSKTQTTNYGDDYFRKCDLSSTLGTLQLYTYVPSSGTSQWYSEYNISKDKLQLYRSYIGSGYGYENNTTTYLYYR
jgi:hypothetical protein